MLGPGAAGEEVVSDLVEPRKHLRIDVQHRAAKTSMLMLTRSSVRTGTATQFDLTPVEMLFEPDPLDIGDRPILLGGPDLSAPVEESLVVTDDILVEHGDVASRGLQIEVTKKRCPDVNGQTV